MSKKIAIGIAGSSGAIYAKLLLDQLLSIQSEKDVEIGVVMSENALINWELELGDADFSAYPFTFYNKNDFNAPFASGSANYDGMIICPCSMGVLGRIANGFSDDLMTRAADVMLKERKKLILVARETPLSLIHLKNMVKVTEAGGIVLPAIPSFYQDSKAIEDIFKTVVDRALQLMGFDQDVFRWGE